VEMDVTAKFRADIADMTAKMNTLNKQLKGVGDAADDASKTISDKFQAAGKKMTDVGKKMSLAVTAPLAGVGIAAVKTSMDFESSLSKMVGLVGLTTDEVDGMKDSILELSGATAKAPQELADAMFVVTSAGLRGDAALQALDQAARASAAGLGDTADIARSVAGAVNAYGAANLDAAKATDVIVATARAGNFETSQFAGAIGRVLPFAKQAGSSIEDMGGAVALLTRTNGDAAQSVTQVAALFRSFVVPTEEAKKILDDVGMSAGDFRKAISEDGLPAALALLDDKLGGNREQLGKVLGSSEAASAAFQILDADAEAIAGTFGTVQDSVGMTGEAFDAAAETSGFKFQQAMVAIKAALIEIGDVIAPVVAKIAEEFKALVDRFSELSPGVKTATVVVGAFAAAAGPALIVAGQMANAVGGLTKAFAAMPAVLSKVTGAMKALNLAFLANPVGLVIAGIVAAVAGLAVAFKVIYDRSAELRRAVQQVIDVFKNVVGVIVGDVMRAFSGLFGSQKKTGDGMSSFSDILQTIADKVAPVLVNVMKGVGNYIKVLGNIVRVVIKVWEVQLTVFKMIANVIRAVVIAAVKKLGDIFSGLLDKLGPVGRAIKTFASNAANAFKNIPAIVSGAVKGAVGFLENVINAAIGGVNAVIRAYNKLADVTPGVSRVAEIAEFRFNSFSGAMQGTGKSADHLTSSTQTLRYTQDQLASSARDSFRATQNLGDAADETTDEVDDLGSASSGAADKQDKLKEKIDAVVDRIKRLGEVGKGWTDFLDDINKPAFESGSIEQWDYLTGNVNTATDAWNRFADSLPKVVTDKTITRLNNLSGNLQESLGAALDQAKSNLASATQAFDQFASSVSNSLTQSISFADAWSQGSETGEGFMSALQEQSNKAVEFAENVKKLIAAGLSEAALQQVLSAGTEAGNKIAQELLTGGQTTIDQANDIVDASQRAADEVGVLAADRYKQAGIDNATQQVNGIMEQINTMTPQIMAVMDKLAKKMRRQVTIKVKVSQSKFNVDVYVDRHIREHVTKYVSEVKVEGRAKGGPVAARSLYLVGERGPEFFVPHTNGEIIPNNNIGKMPPMGGGSRMAGGSGTTNNVININVNTGIATDPAETGRQVVEAIRKYERRSGPVFASA
jgi:TP901 family phage tail tape measure protein